jgi:hypothetical protein
MSQEIDAVVLAGDKIGNKPVKEENKAFLRIKGKTSLSFVIDSLRESTTIGKIAVVGPRERLRDTLSKEQREAFETGRLHIVSQRRNIIENVRAGFFSFLPFTHEEMQTGEEILTRRSNEYREKPILVLPSDIPLVLPSEIDQFANAAHMDRYDYAIGITAEDVLSRFYPTAETPGIRMSYFQTREGAFRQNNLHIGKILKVPGLFFIEKMYQLRYQRKIFNMMRMIFGLFLRRRMNLDLFKVFIMLQLARYAEEHGFEHLRSRFSETLPLERLLSIISEFLEAKTQAVRTSYGGAALDVDNAGDFEAATAMFDVWRDKQKTIDAM